MKWCFEILASFVIRTRSAMESLLSESGDKLGHLANAKILLILQPGQLSRQINIIIINNGDSELIN